MKALDCLTQTLTVSSKSENFWTPNHLQAVCGLYNFESPPLKYARILVLGCEGGESLLSFAASFPLSRVVGIDLVTEGKEERQYQLMKGAPENLELYSFSVDQIMGLQDNN